MSYLGPLLPVFVWARERLADPVELLSPQQMVWTAKGVYVVTSRGFRVRIRFVRRSLWGNIYSRTRLGCIIIFRNFGVESGIRSGWLWRSKVISILGCGCFGLKVFWSHEGCGHNTFGFIIKHNILRNFFIRICVENTLMSGNGGNSEVSSFTASASEGGT